MHIGLPYINSSRCRPVYIPYGGRESSSAGDRTSENSVGIIGWKYMHVRLALPRNCSRTRLCSPALSVIRSLQIGFHCCCQVYMLYGNYMHSRLLVSHHHFIIQLPRSALILLCGPEKDLTQRSNSSSAQHQRLQASVCCRLSKQVSYVFSQSVR